MYLPTTDDEATVIDHGPHWSARPMTTLPRPVQKSSVQPTAPVPGPYMLPTPFYSYAEEQASMALDTECVAPLPMSSLRPDWQLWIAAKWTRYAVPFCGAAAGLILIIAYLALGGENRAVAASAATPSAIVMHVDGPAPTSRDAAVRKAIAMARSGAAAAPTEMVDIEEAATTGTIVAAEADEIEMDAVPMKRPAKHVVKHSKRAKPSSKRGPIKLNAKTALGDLRVGRSR
jgi:hypothetical protein